MNRVVTLTTDLGNQDYYVGMVKGAILTASSQMQLVDITHEIPSFDIVQGAYILRNVYNHFPPGTVHLISVNNNYNVQNVYILFERDGYFFVGPNNGLFSLVFERLPDQVFELKGTRGGAFPVRDIFAKVIRHLDRGDTLNEIGDPATNLVMRMNLQPVVTRSHIRGSVIHVDKFDNVVLNITRDVFERARKGRDFALFFKRFEPITSISEHYFDVPVGETLCVINSADHLEIAINMGKAASLLGLKEDETVQIDFYDEP
ncbi:MAG: SAM-dependent chlorinase/fluorinase [Saprospiraceae bacterium]|nr:SAM-dependent chlorinase/fluorinase [Saprospiraceae bacterium]